MHGRQLLKSGFIMLLVTTRHVSALFVVIVVIFSGTLSFGFDTFDIRVILELKSFLPHHKVLMLLNRFSWKLFASRITYRYLMKSTRTPATNAVPTVACLVRIRYLLNPFIAIIYGVCQKILA